MTHDVHCCVTVFYQPIENNNIANQIHGFTIDYGIFILTAISVQWLELIYEMATLFRFAKVLEETFDKNG